VPRLKLLLLLALAHVVVDTIALVIQPLWPDLRSGLALSDAQFQGAFVLWNVANSLLQLPIGYWAERHQARWLIWAGPALAAACVSGVGLVGSFWGLCLLLAAGGAGIAAFHPEAAAMVASCAPGNRSRALSVFSIGGYLGQAIGPLYAGTLTAAYGLSAVAWTLVWGWIALAAVSLGLRCAPSSVAVAEMSVVPLGRLLSGKKKALALLVALGVLRVTPVLGVPLALAFALKETGGANDDVGFAQSLFMAAIGAGSVACAALANRSNQRRAFCLLPLAATAALAVCPSAPSTLVLACVALSGMALGATLPLLVACGQEMLPQGQRVASGLTMGVTWGLASPLAVGTVELFDRLNRPAGAFYVFAGVAAASSFLCVGLPDREAEPS
jgi:FSR family fosmidomycin resistance protein-like MFS transporter